MDGEDVNCQTTSEGVEGGELLLRVGIRRTAGFRGENGALHPLGAGCPGRFAMAIYTQVDYNVASPHSIVSQCLIKKRASATRGSPDKIPGIGPVSCWSAAHVWIGGNRNVSMTIFGNSRNKVLYRGTAVACVHGECNVLWDAYDEAGDETLNVLSMYIEMHPCANCSSALSNLMPANLEVLYSFPYVDGVTNWSAAARALCR